MSWFKKIAQKNISIDMQEYINNVNNYFAELYERSYNRTQELSSYSPDFIQLQNDLQSIGYPNPQQAISTLQSGEWKEGYQIYRELSDLFYKIPYNDPKRQQLEPIFERVKQNIRNITDKKDEYPFSQKDSIKLAQETIQTSTIRLQKIQQLISNAIHNIEFNSPIVVKATEPPSDFGFAKANYGTPLSGAEIEVGSQTNWGGTPSFTLFVDFDDNNNITKYEVDDILEGGDTDFFTDNNAQNDYFALVSELQHPGRSEKDKEKILTLYTARPMEHRNQFAETRSIPPNIFLTSNYQNAVGMAHDFGKRDVWKVRIKSKYLIQTMDAQNERWYQVKSQSESVPVESITLIDPWQ